MSNQERWILITGCSTGIGRALIAQLQALKWSVIATARDPQSLSNIPEGSNLVKLQLDVTDQASIDAAVASSSHLRLVGIINNAGYGQAGPLEYLKTEELRAQFETNVMGLHAVTRAFLPVIRKHANPKEGRVVHIASMLGRATIPLAGAYSSSKYAVVSLGEALRMELAPDIHVMTIEPGAVRTEFRETLTKVWGDLPKRAIGTRYESILERYLAHGKAASQRWGRDANNSAKKIAKAINSERPPRRVVIGPDAHVGLFLHKILPSCIFEYLVRKIYGLV